MAEQTNPPLRGLIPHLTVRGGKAAAEFYKKAFGAEELQRLDADDGKRQTTRSQLTPHQPGEFLMLATKRSSACVADCERNLSAPAASVGPVASGQVHRHRIDRRLHPFCLTVNRRGGIAIGGSHV